MHLDYTKTRPTRHYRSFYMLIFRPISVPIGLLHCLHPKSSLLPTGTEILKTLLTVPAIMLHQTRFRHIFSFLLCLNGAHIFTRTSIYLDKNNSLSGFYVPEISSQPSS